MYYILVFYLFAYTGGFPGGSDGKEFTCNAGYPDLNLAGLLKHFGNMHDLHQTEQLATTISL